MADPAIVSVPQGAWTKVATNITSGWVHILDSDGYDVLQTYRTTGGTAPAGKEEGVAIKDGNAQISAYSGIDVYLFCEFAIAKVRVDS
jgi:hypothetical protein